MHRRDAPWRETALAQLNAVLQKAGKPVEQAAAPAPSGGPSQEQIAAASEMAPQARQQMIEGMVAGLAERLEVRPSDKEGWLKLIRAYGVMGDDARALEAITHRARRQCAAMRHSKPNSRALKPRSARRQGRTQ